MVDIPFGMAQLSEKKFKEINFKGNPLADPRCKRILEREKLPVKPLLAHLKKMEKQGGGKLSKKQQKAADIAARNAAEAEAAAEAAPEPAPELSVGVIKSRIKFVYEQKNAEKVGDVPQLMEKYVFGAVCSVYACRRLIDLDWCCLLCIYMPAIDRSRLVLSALYMHAGD